MSFWHTCEKCRKSFTHEATFIEHVKNCKGKSSKKTQQNNSSENKTNSQTTPINQTEKSK
jgi:hypothetical protein